MESAAQLMEEALVVARSDGQPTSGEDTPETEHALHGVWYRGDHGSAIPALCRKLERERNELMRRIAEWRALSDDDLRQRCGEMTAQEIRAVRRVMSELE